MRTFLSHRSGCRRVLYVANGPSADNAKECRGFGHVATSNEACLTVPGVVDYAVFADLEPLVRARSGWDRVRTFLLPDRFHVNAGPSPVEPSWIPGFPVERTLIFPIEPIVYTDEQTREAIATEAHLALCNASCAGLHALVMLGYREVWLLGHDGGMDYAAALGAVPPRDHTPIRQRMELIADCLKDKYGADIRFWPAMF